MEVRIARVAVDGSLHPVPAADFPDAADVLDQPVGRHRDVLDERRDALRPGQALENLHGALADQPQPLLLGRVVRLDAAERQPQVVDHALAHAADERLVLRARIGELLDQQDRVGLGRQVLLGDRPVGPDDVQEPPLHDFAGGGAEVEDGADGLAGLLQVREPEEQARALARLLDHADGRLDHDGQRPLAAGHEAREVEPAAVQHVEQVVAGAVLAGVRPVGADEVGVHVQDLPRARDDAAKQVAAVGEFAVRRTVGLHALQPHLRPVGQDHVEGRHVLAERAVPDAAGARRVVPQVAADGAERFAGRVRPQHQAVRRKGLVDLAGDGARLDADAPAGDVHRQDAIHIFREVDDDAAAEGLPGQARPRPAGGHGDAQAGGCADGLGHVVGRLRHHDRQRRDAVDARRRRVRRPAEPVGQHVALDAAGQGAGHVVARHGLGRCLGHACVP